MDTRELRARLVKNTQEDPVGYLIAYGVAVYAVAMVVIWGVLAWLR